MSKCKLCWDGDIGEWDASISPEIQDLLNDRVSRKFVGSLEDRVILERVLSLSVQSWVVAGNKRMFKTHGILSGMWITNLFNSIINRCYTAGWYYREYVKRFGEEPTVSQFLREIVDIVQGDDKIVGMRSKDLLAHEYLNAITMREYYESCGMTFTDGKKGLIDYKGKPLEDCSFLNRNFRFHDDLMKVVGPIDAETITNSLMWYKDDNEHDEIMQDKLLVFQREAYLMDPEIGRNLVSIVAKSIQANKLAYRLVSEEYIRNMFLEDPNGAYDHTKRTNGKYY
jgi:hypothetical protein